MIKRLLLLLIIASGYAQAQFVTVKAVVSDRNNHLYANCSWHVTFLGDPSSTIHGSAFDQSFTGTCNADAYMSLTLPQNSQIHPFGSQWTVAFCNSTGVFCASTPLTIGHSDPQDISVSLRSVAPILPSILPYLDLVANLSNPTNPDYGAARIFYNQNTARVEAIDPNGVNVLFGGSGGGGVSSIATTAPIVGGPITANGTISCPACALGPGTSVAGHVVIFSGSNGLSLADGGAAPGGNAVLLAPTGAQIVSGGFDLTVNSNFQIDGSGNLLVGGISLNEATNDGHFGAVSIGTSISDCGTSGSTCWITGAGSPEGVVTAHVGSLYSDSNALGGVYYKSNGVSNTGWLVFSSASLASPGPIGGTTPSTITSTISDGVINGLADTTGGHDFCQKIATAFASLTSGNNYHVRAQSLNASDACSVNPFASLPSNTSGVLEISSPLIVSTAEIKLPTQWRMVGMSRGTIIQSGTLTANSLITLGDRGSDTGISANRFGVRIENLTVDCNSNASLTYCVYSETMQEQSGLEHVLIKGCKICIRVDDTVNATPQNWHMDDLEVYPQNTANAIGIDVDGASSGMHSITGVTVLGKAVDTIGLRFNNMRGGSFTGIHCEALADCVLVGDTGNAYGSSFAGLSGQTNVTNLVHIASGHTIKGLSFSGLARLGSTALILDEYRTYTTAVDGMAFYSTGDVASTTGPMFNAGFSSQGDIHLAIPNSTGSASSKLLYFDGLYNNGATNFNVDSWTIKNLVNAGTNPVTTLTFTHSGSSGTPTINMPYNVTFASSAQVTAAGSFFGGAFISTTANPAQSGAFRLASGDILNFRNNANDAQINGLSKNSSDVVLVGGAAGQSAAAYLTNTKCAAAGSAANPSVAACSAAPSGSFSCATNASTGTCTVTTSAVTAASAIFVQPDSSLSTLLSVTCNTTADSGLTAPRVSARSAATSFTITLGTFATNPLCYSYWIVN